MASVARVAAKLDATVVELLDGGSHHYDVKEQPRELLGTTRPIR